MKKLWLTMVGVLLVSLCFALTACPGSSVEIESVTLSETVKTLAVGADFTLTATVVVTPDEDANKEVTWSTSSAAKATVNSSGKVTAVSAGEVIITATSTKDSSKKATCTVTITVAAATNKIQAIEDAYVAAGYTTTITGDTKDLIDALKASYSPLGVEMTFVCKTSSLEVIYVFYTTNQTAMTAIKTAHTSLLYSVKESGNYFAASTLTTGANFAPFDSALAA